MHKTFSMSLKMVNAPNANANANDTRLQPQTPKATIADDEVIFDALFIMHLTILMRISLHFVCFP